MLSKEIIADFTGNGESFHHWVTQFYSVANTYNLNENLMKALISTKLKGRSLRWFYSRSDAMSLSVENLLAEMELLFEDRSSRLVLAKEFEARKWQPNETFQEYFNEKIILSNKISISDMDLIEHIIDGIPDYILRSQAKMQRFKDKQSLLKAFQGVKLRKEKPTKIDLTQQSKQRCFNCNSLGHLAVECRKPKREGGACHVCAQKGHFAAECPKRNINHVDEQADGNGDDYVRNIKYSFIKDSYILQSTLGTLIDTGSSISFIRQQFVPTYF